MYYMRTFHWYATVRLAERFLNTASYSESAYALAQQEILVKETSDRRVLLCACASLPEVDSTHEPNVLCTGIPRLEHTTTIDKVRKTKQDWNSFKMEAPFRTCSHNQLSKTEQDVKTSCIRDWRPEWQHEIGISCKECITVYS
jgi:hypothetical protein